MSLGRRSLLGAAMLSAGRFATPSAQAAARAFRMAYFATYSPLSFMEGSELKGILVDVLHEVLTGGVGLQCRDEPLPWPRAQMLVEQGDCDAICTIATPQRLAYAVAVDEPVVKAVNCIFVRDDHPMLAALARVKSLDELRTLNPKILSYSANGWARSKLQDFDVTWGGDFNSAVKMLVAKRGDIMVENALTMSYTLKRTPGAESIRMMTNALDQANFQLLISKRSPYLDRRDDIQRAIRLFKQTPKYAEIFRRYDVSAWR